MDRKEAIEVVRKKVDYYEADKRLKAALEALIPELAESEDERMLGKVLECITYVADHNLLDGDVSETHLKAWLLSHLDLLEKQKEHKPKMTPTWLYRLEFKDSSCGLWYDGSGKWCFESGIGSIGGCKTKTLPMDYDARYKQDGRDWFSSCSRKEDLMHWYSLEDAKELISKGFVFTRYLATEYHEYDQQTVFIKETALCREQIDIFELFGQKSAGWSEEEVAIIDGIIQDVRNTKMRAEEDVDYPTTKEELDAYDEEVDFLNRLKSLRPQPHWKPTEEQMEAMRSAVKLYKDTHFEVHHEKIVSLYEQLKKL